MAPYTELQEPVTPTYEPENSDAKDLHIGGIAPSVMVPNDLTEPMRKNSLTGAPGAGDRQPRRPRRRVKSMPLNSEGAQDFFGPGARSSHRYERHGSTPEAIPDTLLLLKETESIEEAVEEDAAEQPIQVLKMNVRKDVKTKTDTVDAKSDSTCPSSPCPSEKPLPSNQVGTECSCVIL